MPAKKIKLTFACGTKSTITPSVDSDAVAAIFQETCKHVAQCEICAEVKNKTKKVGAK